MLEPQPGEPAAPPVSFVKWLDVELRAPSPAARSLARAT